MNELVLASKSPRRRELIKLLGHPFICIPSNIEEYYIEEETPAEHVTRLSELKAVNVGQTLEHCIVIGSDTVVVIDDDIIGKPRTADEALEMIMRLQGCTHTVFTGFAIYNTENKKMFSSYETSEVTMRKISLDMAKQYIDTKEPLDKAGAYGIQGYGAVLIESIKGCFFNVMGLPLSRLMEALHTSTSGRYGYFGTTGELLS